MARTDSNRELTDKQSAFVREYCIDKNATQAAIRAGYSVKTAGWIGQQLLAKTHIRVAVDTLIAKLAEKTGTDAEWVRRRLKEEADDRSENATHGGRIRALELIGKINGVFEVDNRQKAVDAPVFRVCFDKPEGRKPQWLGDANGGENV